MSELPEELSERIIEAAGRGDEVDGAGALSGLLTAFHRPPAPRELPGLPAAAVQATVAGRGARRFALRTGVAATAAVLGLAGTAAALAGGLVLLEPVIPDGGTTVSAVADAGGGESDGSPSDAADDEDGSELAVDASDGLDAEELAVLCEAAERHGEYVAAVARDRAGDGEGSHGERVGDAAGSDCGTPDGSRDGEAGGSPGMGLGSGGGDHPQGPPADGQGHGRP